MLNTMHGKAVLLAACAIVPLVAQTPPTQPQQSPSPSPQFEVASIKPNKSADNRIAIQIQPGGRFVATNVTVKQLIRNAYQLQDFQMVGGPSWISEDHYDVNAKAESDGSTNPFRADKPGEPSRGQLMLRALLAERFKFAAHNEEREMPIYALILARNDGKLGPQLTKSAIDCSAMAPGRGPGGTAGPGARVQTGEPGAQGGPGGTPGAAGAAGPGAAGAPGAARVQAGGPGAQGGPGGQGAPVGSAESGGPAGTAGANGPAGPGAAGPANSSGGGPRVQAGGPGGPGGSGGPAGTAGANGPAGPGAAGPANSSGGGPRVQAGGPGGPGSSGGAMPCGIRVGPGSMSVNGGTMAQFVGSLAMWVGRVVIDKTGLAGGYDFNLTWTPDQMPQRPAGAGGPEPPPIDPNGPSIFTAVQEQLGLKLDSRRGPVSVLVIDHVEHPVED